MKLSTLAAIVAVLPGLLLSPTSNAAPSAQPAPPTPSVQARPQIKVKALSELTMKNVGTVPGEKRTYEAVLKTKAGDPLANRKVSFRIESKNGSNVPNGGIVIGEDNTDAQGKAKVDFSLPELAQGNYALKASFAGDDEYAGDKVESNLLVVKAITKIELSNLMWGTYKNEPGAPYGTIGINLIRQSDSKSLPKQMTITVNGKTSTLYAGSSGYHQMVLMPMDAKTWNVKVQFEGDDYAMASSAERTYTRPN
jgi:hypothetical protein